VSDISSRVTRRSFLGTGMLAPAAWASLPHANVPASDRRTTDDEPRLERVGAPEQTLDLTPARWVWYPSTRTLPNTVVLFRRTFDVPPGVTALSGHLLADSRYVLFVNGARVQAGPAPADPRWPEADPIDVPLVPGRNTIGVLVLFYGHGEGTWPAGKPGLLLRAASPDGSVTLTSDGSWRAHLARAWSPGQYKRWYLRSLQEEFDARLFPYGWTSPAFDDSAWVDAMELDGSAARPSIATRYNDYANDTMPVAVAETAIVPRSIPLLVESVVPVARLAERYRVRWLRPPEEYFEMAGPRAFDVAALPLGNEPAGAWHVAPQAGEGEALTFELTEQVVGWPAFTIDAAEGTVVEMMVQEAHETGGRAPLLNTHFHAWTRVTCREGENRFEALDFESLRWLQLHVRSASRPAVVRDVHVRRRLYPWPQWPTVETGEPALDRLVSATVNTLRNSAQDTLVDGMGRERQQYSGDCGHQIHALHHAFGERRQVTRFVHTFSDGMTEDGFFLDCWPAWDRLARLSQRQLGLTPWGPLLDHGVGFVFDCYHQWMYTGNLALVQRPFPRLLRFASYLRGLRRPDGLLPVEELGVPWVWMDTDAYTKQRHKRCAFNLYAAAMAEHALAPLCRAFGHERDAADAEAFGRGLREAAVQTFWDPVEGLFVANRPWLEAEGQPRACDRSLATSVLFDQCPGGRVAPALEALDRCPAWMGFSYPANAGWRLWALARGGRIARVVADLRDRWATLSSVVLNNTLQESWRVEPDSGSQWSHCPVVPLYVLHMSVLGLNPTAPGFARYELRPQLGDLATFSIVSYAPPQPLALDAKGRHGARSVRITTPAEGDGVLWLDAREKVTLPAAAAPPRPGLASWSLPRDATVTLSLAFT
jgi:hypothetical protein